MHETPSPLDTAGEIELTGTRATPGPLENHLFHVELVRSGITQELLDAHGENVWLRGPAGAAWNVFHLDTYQSMGYSSWLNDVAGRVELSGGRPVQLVLHGEHALTLDQLEESEDGTRVVYGVYTTLTGTVPPDGVDFRSDHLTLEHAGACTLRIPLSGVLAVLVEVEGRWYGDLYR